MKPSSYVVLQAVLMLPQIFASLLGNIITHLDFALRSSNGRTPRVVDITWTWVETRKFCLASWQEAQTNPLKRPFLRENNATYKTSTAKTSFRQVIN